MMLSQQSIPRCQALVRSPSGNLLEVPEAVGFKVPTTRPVPKHGGVC